MKVLSTAALIAAFGCLVCSFGGLYIAVAAFGALALVYARLAQLNVRLTSANALRGAGIEALVNGDVDRVASLAEAFTAVAKRDDTVASTRAQLLAFVATAKGDPRGAVKVLDELMARESGRALAAHRPQYLAIRAVAHALAGNDDLALADAEATLATSPTAPSVARATLAKALVVSRKGDADRLRELAVRLPPMLWALLRHERTLARAIVRTTRPSTTSAYRGGAGPNAAPWFAANIPALGAVAPPTVQRHGRHVAIVAPATAKPWAAWVAYGVTAMGVGIAIAMQRHGIPEPGPLAMIISLFAVVVAVVQITLMGRAILRQRRSAAGLNRVQLLSVQDDRAAVWSELERLVRKVDHPSVRLQRAAWLGADGKLRAALDEIALGLASISVRARGFDPQYPDLLGERAALFAALGHEREANGALEDLERGFAGLPHLEIVQHQVAVLTNVRAKRWSDAFESARLGVGLTLPVRDELLTESLVAIADDDAHAAALLITEIEARTDIAHWFEVVTPGVLERLRSAGRA